MNSVVNWDMSLQCSAVTDVGMRRANNQDAHAVVLAGDMDLWRHRGHLLIVADGMGAHAAGELASELAVNGIPHHYHKYMDLSAPSALEKAFQETNAEVHRRGQANLEFHNMGTTTSALALLPQGCLVAHVGDSRIYRLRGGTLEQLTSDHSLLWAMLDSNHGFRESDLAQTVPKNVITRSLGPNPNLEVDFEGPFPIELGDTFLLCTDGLTGQVSEDEIGPLLAHLAPSEAAQVLVDLANLRGGPDNITAIVARVVGDELTTRVAADEPLTVGRESGPARIHPAAWVLAGACFLAAIAMLMTGRYLPALVAGGGGVIAVLFGVLYRLLSQAQGVQLIDGRRFGKGPYRRWQCATSPALVQQLAEMADELREATVERGWAVTWDAFETHCRQADAAFRAGDHPEALRHYAQAISAMMCELRSQRARQLQPDTPEEADNPHVSPDDRPLFGRPDFPI